jgi:dihydroorotase-like cyclic amidohydrolase
MHIDNVRGAIAPGKYADFAVWDPSASILCTDQTIRSAVKDNCIYQHQILECEVTHTFLRGVLIYKHGQLLVPQGRILLSGDRGRISTTLTSMP